jgi:hypothetical protein
MDGQHFDLVGKWLARRDSRRSTLRGLVAGAFAIGLGRLSLEEAAAKCQKIGQKCQKNSECCSKLCKGGTCKCRKLGSPCDAWADCCTGLICSQAKGNTCQPLKLPPLCYPLGSFCTETADCCKGLVCFEHICQ